MRHIKLFGWNLYWRTGPYQQYDPATPRGAKWFQLSGWNKRWHFYLNIDPRGRG